MSECILLKGGGTDLDVVTAGFGDVLSPKVIVGADGEPLTGGIVSMSGQTITPSTSKQTISCAGKYMTGNVVVNGYGTKYKLNTKTNSTSYTIERGVTATLFSGIPTNAYVMGLINATWFSYTFTNHPFGFYPNSGTGNAVGLYVNDYDGFTACGGYIYRSGTNIIIVGQDTNKTTVSGATLYYFVTA